MKFTFIILFIIFSFSCKKESQTKAGLEKAFITEAEIDVQKIESLTGIQCKILKIETIGYMPINKFYWVCLGEKISSVKVEDLAEAIIKETIAKKPNTFHSFTIHFFCESELAETLERSRCFARAKFLPEGDPLKVGRVPIEDYKSYKLVLTILEYPNNRVSQDYW